MNNELDTPNVELSEGAKLKKDFIAGLVVFLVALPLCLGIALASEAPLASGLLAGIIGGLVVGSISGSSTSVSGPAAGLTAIVSAQIALMGDAGFAGFLTAVFLAGIIQIVMGCLKAGALSAFFPSSVIKGLLAAIGTILILKQILYFFGGAKDFESAYELEKPFGILQDAATVFEGNMQQGPLVVGIICITLLIVWPRIAALKKTSFPPALAVVLLGVILQILMSGMGENWEFSKEHLVDVPSLFGDSAAEATEATATDAANTDGNTSEEQKWIVFPDFSVLGSFQVYLAAITIAIVASLETLLNLEAVDKLDPKKRPSPPSRELIAQGVGNTIGGLIGSLPVTSVIIRSSVNIHVGVETKKSTIIHGIFLVLSVAVFATYLNYIPLTSLAAILLMTGWKLANPKLFRSLWKMGARQFVPFIVTLVAIVFTDLLLGVIIGMVIGLIFVMLSTVWNPLITAAKVFDSEVTLNDDPIRLVLARHVSFLSRLKIKKVLHSIEPNSTVIFDGTKNEFIDEDTLEMIADYIKESAKEGINASAEGLELPEESAGLH